MTTIIVCALMITFITLVYEVRLDKKNRIIARREKFIQDFRLAGENLLEDFKIVAEILEEHFEDDEIDAMFFQKKSKREDIKEFLEGQKQRREED